MAKTNKKQTLITIADLIAKKEQIAEQREKNKRPKKVILHVDSLDGDITIENVGTDVIEDSMRISDKDPKGADRKLVYECVTSPNLKDKKLQEAYGCFEPIEIVNKLFEDAEIAQITMEILKMYGISTEAKVTVVEEIKN